MISPGLSPYRGIIFFAICTQVKDKSTNLVELTFDEIKELTAQAAAIVKEIRG